MIATLLMLVGAISPQLPGVNYNIPGWTHLNTSDQGDEVFVQPGRVPRSIWVRYEHHDAGQLNELSTRNLIEIDCENWRYRATQITGFSGRNFSGKSETSHLPNGRWAFAAPGTMGDKQLEWACNPATFGGSPSARAR